MHVSLADVFVDGIVGDEPDNVLLVGLAVDELVVVSHGGQQAGERLFRILVRARRVGDRALKLRIVLARAI